MTEFSAVVPNISDDTMKGSEPVKETAKPTKQLYIGWTIALIAVIVCLCLLLFYRLYCMFEKEPPAEVAKVKEPPQPTKPTVAVDDADDEVLKKFAAPTISRPRDDMADVSNVDNAVVEEFDDNVEEMDMQAVLKEIAEEKKAAAATAVEQRISEGPQITSYCSLVITKGQRAGEVCGKKNARGSDRCSTHAR